MARLCPAPPFPSGSYTLPLNRTPRTLADMEWDTVGRGVDIELSSNCLTATKASSAVSSTVRGTILYADRGCHEFHVILDNLGPDGIWVGVAPPAVDAARCVGDAGCGWALHSDGDRRFGGREEEFTGGRGWAWLGRKPACLGRGAAKQTLQPPQTAWGWCCPPLLKRPFFTTIPTPLSPARSPGAFKNGDVLTVGIDLGRGVLRFSRNGVHLGEAFSGITGPLVAAVTLASEESKVTIQNRPTVLNMGEYTGEARVGLLCRRRGLGLGTSASPRTDVQGSCC
jgi:hypothetical protein